MKSEVWLGLLGVDGQELSLGTCVGYKRVKVVLENGASGPVDFPQACNDWGEVIGVGIYADATTPLKLGSSDLGQVMHIATSTTLRMESMVVDSDHAIPSLLDHVFGDNIRGEVGLYTDMEPGQRDELTKKMARARQVLGKVGGKE